MSERPASAQEVAEALRAVFTAADGHLDTAVIQRAATLTVELLSEIDRRRAADTQRERRNAAILSADKALKRSGTWLQAERVRILSARFQLSESQVHKLLSRHDEMGPCFTSAHLLPRE